MADQPKLVLSNTRLHQLMGKRTGTRLERALWRYTHRNQFHDMLELNEIMEAVREEEQKKHTTLKRHVKSIAEALQVYLDEEERSDCG